MDRSSAAVWHLQLFGGLHAARQPDGAITRFRSHNAAALLAYLALFPKRSHSREELADLLWPEADADVGRVNLRTVLSALRRDLEPGGVPAGSVLVTTGHRDVRLAPGAVETDVVRFERALRSAVSGGAAAASPGETTLLLEEATAVYHGPLLPGFYEDWIVAERNRLAGLYVDALKRLSGIRERAGDAAGAEELSRRVLAADPLSEEAHASLIRLRAAAGDRAGALRQFREMERLLDEHLGVSPGLEVRTLVESLRDAGTPDPPPLPRAAATPPDANTFGTAGRGGAESGASRAPTLAPAWPDPAGPLPCPVCLPTPFTTFCGREDEVAALSGLLRSGQTRLVTVTGLGGSGKTRLAVETARHLVGHFAGGVLFVPLADVRESERLPEAIADTLGLPRSTAVPLFDQVARALNRAALPVLLVLDNFEQVAEEGAALVQALLAASPALHCLVTSRRRLLVEAEREFALAPLPIPEHPGTPERLLEFASVQLFVSRARAARGDFELNARNASAVAELCTRLEGVPLALELAAAWAHMLTPAQILERLLGRRYDLLVARRRDAVPRHATLRSTMAWGLELLSPESRDFFAHLSVFRGGFTLEAVEEICEVPDALTLLAALRDQSLLLAEEPGGGDDGAGDASPDRMRYRMLETVREFAEEQREQWPAERRARLSARHAAYLLRKAEEAGPHLRGSRQQRHWLDQLQAERANLDAALEWTRAAADGSGADGGPERAAEALVTHLRLCGALWPFWYVRGHLGEAARWLLREDFPRGDSGGEGGGVPPVVLARALHARAEVAHLREELDRSAEALEAALTLYRRVGDRSGEGQVLARLARWGNDVPYARRRAMARAARRLCRAAGDSRAEAEVLTDQAWLIRCQAENYPRAQQFMARAVALYRAAGDEAQVIGALRERGTWHAWASNTDRARPLLDEALAMARRQDNVREAGYLLWIRGYVAVLDDDLDDAAEMLREGVMVARTIGDGWCLLLNLVQLSLAQLGSGDEAAAEVTLRECLPLARHTCERMRVRTLPELFLGYECLAMIAARRGDLPRAARLLGVAWAMGRPGPEEPSAPREYAHAVRERYARMREALRAAPGGLLADWERGRSLEPVQAEDFALGEARTPGP